MLERNHTTMAGLKRQPNGSDPENPKKAKFQNSSQAQKPVKPVKAGASAEGVMGVSLNGNHIYAC
jgi:hypothetical protein